MEVFECPVCELKFHYPSELDDHMAKEHPDFHWEPKSVEDSLLGASHRRRHRTPRYPPNYKADPPLGYRSVGGGDGDGATCGDPASAHPAGGHSERWMERSACQGMDTNLFFGSEEGETVRQREKRERKAKVVCRGCSVIADCLEFALTTKQKFGIWGGLNERERTSELRRRARARRAS